ncbi:unnamed protein product [Peronospora farinosa]|uniref:Ras-GEF domain-containing protein n=1 Tax=Peronospora farinosa TaxID=134698 RepID=A0ABN8CGA4_9STRA|nr:unnamed protein product [Peronospora farinosa]
MDEMLEIIKEGSVAVRGHFMWRNRYVTIKSGEMAIHRRREGPIKAKIDLCDTNMKLTFLGGQSLLTISMHGQNIVCDLRSTVTRDEWISAIVSAQERPSSQVECDENGTKLISDDETDNHDSSMTSMETDESDTMDKESEGYNDSLLALRSARDSAIQCNLSIEESEIDSVNYPHDNPATPAFTKAAVSLRRVQSAQRIEEELRQKRLRALLGMIESSPHGGRVALLHLGVVASAGITVGDMLLALGEKYRNDSRRGSVSPRTQSMQKHNVVAFVCDILLHPIYSKRKEVNTEIVQGLIDLFFPDCRSRRFSDDTDLQHVEPIESAFVDNEDRVTAKSANDADVGTLKSDAPSTFTSILPTPAVRSPQRKKRRIHSFPNLGGITQHARNKGLLLLSADDNERIIKSSKREEGGHRLRDNMPMLPFSDSKCLDGEEDGGIAVSDSSSSEELDVVCEAVLLPVPLRSILSEMSCLELAEQLTLFHHSQLTHVHPWEFLHHPKEAAKNLTDHFNHLVAFFVWSVLVEESPKERAEVIEDIITIAIAASAPPFNNFHLVMACVGCLGDTPLMSSRMPTTWKKVRAKYKTRLGELRQLCDHTGGFEKLRRKQSVESAQLTLSNDKPTTSVIPFIGVIGVMLERLRSTSYFTANKMFDLKKLERQYKVLSVLENALLKPAPRPGSQRGKTSPTEAAAEMTTRLQHFFQTLSMDFATSRLHQLRSQQILVNETSTTIAQGALVNSSNKGENPFATNLPVSRFHSNGLIGPNEDSGLAFVSFRDICVLLVSVPDKQERMQMALEALFLDGCQPATQYLRKFWLAFKQNVWISGIGPTLQSLRLCVSALYQEVMTQKITEVMQVSGLNENSGDLYDMVYAKIVILTVQPVYLHIVSKVKRNYIKDDVNAAARLLQSTPQIVIDTSKPTMPWSSCSCSSPVELLDLVCQLVALPCASTTTATAAASDHQLAVVDLLGALQHQARHTFLATNPVSSMYLMKQILDPMYLPLARRQALEVFVVAVTWLRKKQ